MHQTAKNTRAALLAELPLFESCNKKDLSQLAGATTEATLPEGSVLTREGHAGGIAYVVVDGIAKVTRKGRKVAEVGTGDIVGELSLIDGLPRSATVTATSPIRLLEINEKDFRRIVRQSPRLTRSLLQTLSLRIREKDHQSATMA